MFRWLFRRRISRDEAVAIASRYVETLDDGHRVFSSPEAAGREFGVVVGRVYASEQRWTVWFVKHTPGMIVCPGEFWVWVDAVTGEPQLCPPLL
jgi:hypothetical protein